MALTKHEKGMQEQDPIRPTGGKQSHADGHVSQVVDDVIGRQEGDTALKWGQGSQGVVQGATPTPTGYPHLCVVLISKQCCPFNLQHKTYIVNKF